MMEIIRKIIPYSLYYIYDLVTPPTFAVVLKNYLGRENKVLYDEWVWINEGSNIYTKRLFVDKGPPRRQRA